MKNKVGKSGIILGLLSNVILLVYYGYDVCKYYFKNWYCYDGFRYLIPLFIADVLFFLSIVMLLASEGNSKSIIAFVFLSFLQNLNIGFGIDFIPFTGIIISVLFSSYLIYCLYKKSSASWP